MTTSPNNKVRIIHITPQTWFGRLLATISAITVVILVLFFFSLFFAVFLVLIIVVSGWILWAKRQYRRKASGDTIEGEYSVDNSDPNQHGESNSAEEKRLE